MRRFPALATALLALPFASACIPGPPADHQRLAATGDGGLWTNVGASIGELWLANGSFRPVTDVPALGQWVVSPDGRWAAFERVTVDDATCETNATALEVVDLRTNASRLVFDEPVLSMAASPRHLAVARASADAIELHAWDTGNVTRLPTRIAYDKYYGPGWMANMTIRMAFSQDGRLLAALSASGYGIVVFDVETGEPLRSRAPPYGPPSQDDVVGLAFSPDNAHLAVLTSQDGRFSEVFTWDLAAPSNVVRALRRYTESGVGLAWTDAGLVAAFVDRGWPPGAPTGTLLRYPAPDLADPVESRWEDAAFTGALVADGGILYAGSDVGVQVLDVRTLRPFAREPPPAPEAPTDGTPAPRTDRDAPLPAALAALAILGGAALRNRSRRTRR